MWEHTLRGFGVEPLFVLNYERLRLGNTPFGSWELKLFRWNLPNDAQLIWDEAHRCQGKDSQNARMMASAKPFHNALLSRTLAQDPTEMRAMGFLTGLHGWGNWYRWCLRTGCGKGAFGGLDFRKRTAEKYLLYLHNYLYPEFGGRLRKSDMADYFPDNQVIAQALDFGDDGAIQAKYDAMVDDIAAQEAAGDLNTLGLYQKTRQATELLKVPGLVSLAEDALANGNSVIIFTNYRATLDLIREKLKCDGVYGGQRDEDRERAIAAFQSDASRCLAVNIQAGGVGMSLHDLNGLFPRETLICPPDNAKDLLQVLGRAHRAGGMTPVVQRIVFAAGTAEEQVCERVQERINNIDLLNDADLDPSNSFTEKNKKKLEKRGCFYLAPDLSSGPLRTAASTQPQVASTVPPTTQNAHDNAPSGLAGSESALQIPSVAHSDRKHAPLSPSTLKSKAICPGFQNDPNGDKSFADRGTKGHEGVEKEDLSVAGNDESLRKAISLCLNYRRKLLRQRGKVQIFKEQKLKYHDGQWGFADDIWIGDTHADLLDWKFAIYFYAADSPQFWCYCIGIWDRWQQIDTITVHAVHPFRAQVDVETFSRAKDYARLSGQIKSLISHARRNDPADYRVSDQCRFCGNAGKCVKLALLGREIALRYSDELVLPEGTLHGSQITDPDTFSTLLQIKPVVEKATGGWNKAALELWDSGVAIPEYETVEKGGNRSISSAKAALDVVRLEFPKVTAEQLLDFVDLSATQLDALVNALAPRGDKKHAIKRVNGLLADEEILTRGGGSRYLKKIRE